MIDPLLYSRTEVIWEGEMYYTHWRLAYVLHLSSVMSDSHRLKPTWHLFNIFHRTVGEEVIFFSPACSPSLKSLEDISASVDANKCHSWSCGFPTGSCVVLWRLVTHWTLHFYILCLVPVLDSASRCLLIVCLSSIFLTFMSSLIVIGCGQCVSWLGWRTLRAISNRFATLRQS